MINRLNQKMHAYKANAMSPLNWVLSLTEILLVSGVLASGDVWVKIFCAILMIAILGFYGFVYTYFMFNDKDRLQTEEYNLTSQEMSLLGLKNNGNINLNPDDELIAIGSSSQPSIEKK